jgi:hypothetical protein
VLHLPEPCSQFLVIPNMAADTAAGNHDAPDVTTVGLTSSNRLYVGEHIIHTGVNSVGLNVAFGMLLFVTIGMCQSLRYCSSQLFVVTRSVLSVVHPVMVALGQQALARRCTLCLCPRCSRSTSFRPKTSSCSASASP